MLLSLSLLSGSTAAAGPQAAAEWPAYQTCPEDHEVPAAAQGKNVDLRCVVDHAHRTFTSHTHITQLFILQLYATQQGHSHCCKHAMMHVNTCIRAPMAQWAWCLLRLLPSRRGRGKWVSILTTWYKDHMQKSLKMIIKWRCLNIKLWPWELKLKVGSALVNIPPAVLTLLWAVNLECCGDHAVFIWAGLPEVLHKSWDGHGGVGGWCPETFKFCCLSEAYTNIRI